MTAKTREYAFDVTLLAAIRIHATSEDEARTKLHDVLECATVSAHVDGKPINFEATIEGEGELYEIDGEDPLGCDSAPHVN